MGAKVTDEQVESIFAAADEDDNAKLSFQEFLVFLCIGYLLEELPEIEGFQTAFATTLDAFDVFDVVRRPLQSALPRTFGVTAVEAQSD